MVSRKARRFYRSLLIGIAALGALLWVSVEQFDIPADEIGLLFLTTLAIVLLIIVAAALVVGLWIGLRKLMGPGD